MKRFNTLLALITVLLGAVLGGCGPATPQDRVLALLDEAESAVHARSTPRLRPLLSEDFVGPESINREAAIAMARRYMLMHRNLYLLTRLARVEGKPGADRLHAVVYAALAGQPIKSLDTLSSVKARIMRFELILVPDGLAGARVKEAEWTPATVEDMLLARWRETD